MSQCKATSKRTGERCKAQAVTGRELCYHHGGKSPAGPAHPQYKHGRYSKHLPARLIERYAQSASDPDLLALREDIALVDARLSDLLARVDSGESGEAWKRAQDAVAGLQAGMDGNDVPRMLAAIEDLKKIIRRGLADYLAWQEVGAAIDRRERLVRSERRRLVEMQQVLTLQEGMMLFQRIGDLIEQYVTDRPAKAAILSGMASLLTAGDATDPGR